MGPRKSDGTFAKGVSGNPGGRPARAQGFRNDCRDVAEDLLDVIKERDWTGDFDGAALVQALKVTAALGGFMTTEQEVRALIAIVKARKELTDADWAKFRAVMAGEELPALPPPEEAETEQPKEQEP